MVGQERDYEGMDDAKTLSRAHEIRKDSKRHTNALKHLKVSAKTSSHAQETHAHEQKAVQSAQQSEGSTTNAEPGEEVEY